MNNKLWLIWKDPKERRRYIIGELSKGENYRFVYVNPELDDALKVGFDYFPGFDDLNKEYISETLFANIETRLPNTSRLDYLDILNFYGLDINSSKIEILRKTKGRLLTDNFEFVPVFDKNKIEFDVAGTRHYFDSKEFVDILKINDNLKLEREIDNSSDIYAIKVVYVKDNCNYQLGYVPRYYSKDLARLLDNNILYSAKIEALNLESSLYDDNVTVSVKLIFNIDSDKNRKV